MHARHASAVALVAAVIALAGCSNAAVPAGPSVAVNAASVRTGRPNTSPIAHIVIMVQENRSFDNFFATFKGADGATTGYYLKKVNGQYKRTQITLKEQTLAGLDVNHAWKDYTTDYDNGAMD